MVDSQVQNMDAWCCSDVRSCPNRGSVISRPRRGRLGRNGHAERLIGYANLDVQITEELPATVELN